MEDLKWGCEALVEGISITFIYTVNLGRPPEAVRWCPLHSSRVGHGDHPVDLIRGMNSLCLQVREEPSIYDGRSVPTLQSIGCPSRNGVAELEPSRFGNHDVAYLPRTSRTIAPNDNKFDRHITRRWKDGRQSYSSSTLSGSIVW